MNDITSVILVAGAFALVGAVLLWRGLRGKLQGDHPYCRRCGRNLFGTSSDGKVCPECGADLAVPRAIIIGVRQRRAGMAVTGTAMLLPGVLTLVTVIGAAVSGVDWTKHKPPWLLVHEGQSNDVLTRDAALAELNSRFTAGTLSSAQAVKVVEAGLDYQGHSEKLWSVGWGDFIEAARAKGLVSEEQWNRYAKQAVADSGSAFKLTVRPRLHAGDPLAYQLQSSGGDRVGRSSGLFKLVRISGLTLDGNEMLPEPGSGGFMTLALSPGGAAIAPAIVRTTTATRVFFNGVGIPSGTSATAPAIAYSNGSVSVAGGSGGFGGGGIGGTSTFTFGSRTSASSQGMLDLDPAKMQQLSAGVHSGEVKLEVKVTTNPIVRSPSSGIVHYTYPAGVDASAVQETLRKQQAQAAKDMFAAATPALADAEVKLPAKVEIVPASEETIQRVDNEKLRKQIEACITVSRVRLLGSRLNVLLTCGNPPTDLSYDVVVRQGDKEWPAGTFASPHDERGRGVSYMPVNPNGSRSILLPQDTPSGDYPVDVILRPNPIAALANPAINSYWGGEITVKNVPMDGQTPFIAMPAGSTNVSNPLNLARQIPSRANGLIVNGGSGVVLRIEIQPMKDEKVNEDEPKLTREMLVYPNVPFMQKFSNEDGTTTKISGELNPAVVDSSTQFMLNLDYSILNADGSLKSHDKFNDTGSVTVGKPFSLIKRTDKTVRKVTLSLQPPS